METFNEKLPQSYSSFQSLSEIFLKANLFVASVVNSAVPANTQSLFISFSRANLVTTPIIYPKKRAYLYTFEEYVNCIKYIQYNLVTNHLRFVRCKHEYFFFLSPLCTLHYFKGDSTHATPRFALIGNHEWP